MSVQESSPPLQRIMFVSRTFPADIEHATHGIFQRLRTILAAALGVARRVDVLFMAPTATVASTDVIEHAKRICQAWGIEIGIRLVAMAETTDDWRHHYGNPLRSIDHQPDHGHVATQEQVRVIGGMLDGAELVIAHRLQSAVPIVRAMQRSRRRVPMVVDLDDVEHTRYWRELRRPPHWAGKLVRSLHVPALMITERIVGRSAAALYVCSEHDRRHLHSWLRLDNVEVIPNSVDLRTLPRRAERGVDSVPTLCYLGTYTHQPNIEAAERLALRIFPRIRQAIPQARLEIAGNRAGALSFAADNLAGIEVLGFVADLDALFDRVDLMCCPITSGAGTRIKIIESSARGIPVVSTQLGAEGLDFEDGTEILLREDDESLAQACIALLQDRRRASELGVRARRRAQQYDRTSVDAALRHSLLRAAGRESA